MTRALAYWGLFAVFAFAGCGGGLTGEQRTRFASAEESFAAAETPEDFLRVAGTYQQLLDDGLESAVVYFNQGNAFVRAEQPGHAIACYRQALRLRPRDAAIRTNLEAVLAGTGGAESPPSVFSRVIFWHDDVGYRGKFLLTTVLLVLTGTVIVLSRARSSSVGLRIGWGLGVLLLLSLISVLNDWHTYNNCEFGVVAKADVTARTGNGESYEPAFDASLPEGTEFEVLETRGDWVRVQIVAGECWLETSDVVVY